MTGKLAAGAVGLAMALTSTTSLFAQTSTTTTADLTAQINSLLSTIASLQAQLAAMQGGSSTGTTVTGSFNADLTIGSTGADVVKLQTYLVSKGYLVMPAGVAMGYFGSLTKSAVAKYQAASGITPVAGYFGPLTRARVNAELAATGGTSTGGTGTTTGGTTLNGGEGSIDNFKVLGSPSGETIHEGEAEKVLGFEFKAQDSDLQVDRVDVLVKNDSTSAGQDRPWRVLDSAALYRDGDKIATVDASNEDNWSKTDTSVNNNTNSNQAYRLRFSGVNDVVKMNDTADYYVTFTANDSLNTTDETTYDVALDENGLRAVDAKGLQQYAGNNDSGKTFDINASTQGSLTVSEGSDNPDAQVVAVDDNDSTDNVVMQSFRIKAKDSDVSINSIPVVVSTTGAKASDVVKSVSLYKGSTLLGTESVDSSVASDTVNFDDLNLTINQDDTEDFTVKADINPLSSAFTAGMMASTSVNADTFDAENANGDELTTGDLSGSAAGHDMTFGSTGVTVTVDSTSISQTPATDNTPDRATYTFNLKVTAFGSDIYVPQTASDAINWMNSHSAFASTTGDVAISSGATKTGSSYLVSEDNTETFTVKVVTTGSTSSPAFNSVTLTKLHFGPTNAANTASSTNLTGSQFESDSVNI